jgi:hypothetical protein
VIGVEMSASWELFEVLLITWSQSLASINSIFLENDEIKERIFKNDEMKDLK